MRTYWYKDVGRDWQFASDNSNEFPENHHYIADFAVWNEPLTEMQLRRLKKGHRPNKVAPKKLQKWAPMSVPTKAILGL